MFYDETKTIELVEEDPSLVFELLKEGHIDFVDMLLKKKIVDINTCDEAGNSLMIRLLRLGAYEVVLNNMNNKDWDVNKQNEDGNTFSHYLAVINYVNIIDIISKLKKNKDFDPNIKNNKGETILDKSINDSYMYTTVKILEDSRFNNIDVLSFKKLYDTYVNSDNYGVYAKLGNLDSIINNLSDKELHSSMNTLISDIKSNYKTIKDEILENQRSVIIDEMLNGILQESNV